MGRRAIHYRGDSLCKAGARSGQTTSELTEVSCMNCLTRELKGLKEYESDLRSKLIDASGEARAVQVLIDKLEEERNPRGPG